MMKNQITTLLTLFSFSFANSQIGINTNNPQTIFHIDGANNNPSTGVPSALQARNDVVVTNTGDIGVGTITPNARLDIVGDIFGIKRAQAGAGGSWDNLWLNVANGVAPSINASGAETGLQFKVGANSTGTYGDGQTLTTVATMAPNGNLGIGIESPQKKLHINASNDALRINGLINADRTNNPDGTSRFLSYNTTNGDITHKIYTYAEGVSIAAGATVTITDPSNSINGTFLVRSTTGLNEEGGNITSSFNYARKGLGFLGTAADQATGPGATRSTTGAGVNVVISFRITTLRYDFTVSKPTNNQITIRNNSSTARNFTIVITPNV